MKKNKKVTRDVLVYNFTCMGRNIYSGGMTRISKLKFNKILKILNFPKKHYLTEKDIEK